MRDGLSCERPTVLVWAKRRFRCPAPGCMESFTEPTAQVAPGCRVTARLWVAMARAAWDRSTAAVARTSQVNWATAWWAIAAAARVKIAALPRRPPQRSRIDEPTFRRHGSFIGGLVNQDTARL